MNRKSLPALLILVALVSATCLKIPTMKQEVLNAIDGEEMNFFKTDPNSKQPPVIKAEYYYGNNSLYVSDKKNNRIIAIDEDNKVYLEIGNLLETTTNQNDKFWEKELNTFLAQVDDNESVEKKKKVRASPRKKIRKPYEFKQLDRIIVDFDENIYAVNYEPNGMSILKFDGEGNFVYKIGKEGRDNPSFEKDTTLIDLSVTKDNGFWIKYLYQGILSMRYYNNFGKNILYFEEKSVMNAVTAFLEKKENENYRIEDFFPYYGSNKLSVIINLYKKDSGRYQISRKLIFRLNQEYNVENYFEFNDANLQVFNVNADNNILCFSFYNKEKTPLFKLYDSKGSMLLEKKINLQKFNYARLGVTLTQSGELMGAFLKKKILYFIIWK